MPHLFKGTRLRGVHTRRSSNDKALKTDEIRAILKQANMDFEAVVNRALNAYLPNLFLSCPFTNELCH